MTEPQPAWRPPSAYIHGIDGPTVTLSARFCSWLEWHADLNALRINVRGNDGEVDSILNAIRTAAMAWKNTNSVPGRQSPEPPEEMQSWFTATAAGEYLKMSDRGVRLAISEGRLNAKKQANGQYLIHAEDLIHFQGARRAA
ncbi:helix-turn-helix domain-containing protein [Arthrobacter agilis]|uniref:helix-turn-helix domain-containing protein n=1 Tax=Arthrobacter agilis TaxID=37921 RepID=UPI001ABEF4B2|nr:helix-turn-helix domain-containing protein [Arthrobacter agilis]